MGGIFWSILALVVLLLGLAIRANSLLIVVAAAICAGLSDGKGLIHALELLGRTFAVNRFIFVFWLIIPLIGLLEAHGLQQRLREAIAGIPLLSSGRVLMAYQLLRQSTAAVGLFGALGHVQTVRPVVLPMAEAAAGRPLGSGERQRLRAMAAASENVASFFGQNLFVAVGAILLMTSFLNQTGVAVPPRALALWAVPCAIAALAIHAFRLALLDRRLGRARPDSP